MSEPSLCSGELELEPFFALPSSASASGSAASDTEDPEVGDLCVRSRGAEERGMFIGADLGITSGRTGSSPE